MSKEAMKLAQELRALADRFSEGWHEGIKIDASDIVLLSDAAEALAEQPAQRKYCRGDRLICLETEEYCVIHISGTDRQWVKFPDTHIGVYKNEQLAELFELLPKEIEIEQPAQQEPVVWMYVNKSTHETKFQKHMRDFIDHSLWSEVPLYGEPLANHELQCICGAIWLGDEMVHLPDKRLPPQRTWVGLTDDEILYCVELENPKAIAEEVEAKLKEKNT